MGESPNQQNAIKLNGLPPNFGLVLGDNLGNILQVSLWNQFKFNYLMQPIQLQWI